MNNFHLKIFRFYDENESLSELFKTKYNAVLELYDDMIRGLPKKRPNCEEILERKNSWALKEEEFEINDELEKIIDSKGSENELIYCLLSLKLNSDKAEKFLLDIQNWVKL
jgi:hypothetical protein